MLEKRSVPSLLLNWHIQLAFPLGMHRSRSLLFDFYPATSLAGYAALGALNMREYTAELAAIIAAGSLPEEVKEIVGEEAYALMYVDYFYIPGTAHFGRDHFRHDLLVFDYDSKAQEFKGALYNTPTSMFGEVSIPAANLLEGFTSPHARGPKCSAYCRGNLLAAFKPKLLRGRTAKLDKQDIKIQLQAFLEGTNLTGQPLNNATLTHICQMSARWQQRMVFGLNVYEQLTEYCDQVLAKAETSWLGLRVTRRLWEHKKLMTARLRRLQNEGTALGEEILSAGDEIEQLARFVHAKAYAGWQRQDSAITKSLMSEIDQIKSLETTMFGRLIESLV